MPADEGCLPNQNNHLLEQGVTLRILQRDWDSHEIIANVAAILLREGLRYTVELVPEGSLPAEAQSVDQDFRSLAEGVFDANFELWMSPDKEGEYDKYVKRVGGAKHLGEHFALAEQGMYVPVYSQSDQISPLFFTVFRTAQGLREYGTVQLRSGEADADKAGKCNESAWDCSGFVWRPPHCRQGGADCDNEVQLIRGPSDYESGGLEQRIARNRLNISAVYVTLPSLRRIVWNEYANGHKFLFYNWQPNTPIKGLGARSFQRVKFEPHSKECESPSDTPMNGSSCDAQPTSLQKVVSEHFASSTDAVHFARNFVLTEEDYEQMFKELEGARHDHALAACRWLKRVGPDRWQPWVNYTMQKPLAPFEVSFTDGCWPVFWSQVAVLVLSFLLYYCYSAARSLRARRLMRWSQRCDESGSSLDLPVADEEVEEEMHARLRRCESVHRRKLRFHFKSSQDSATGSTSKLSGHSSQDISEKDLSWVALMTRKACHVFMLTLGMGTAAEEFQSVMKTRQFGFFSFKRDEGSFIESNSVYEIPQKGQRMFRMTIAGNHTLHLFWYLLTSSMHRVLYRSLQYSLAAGALGTLVHLYNLNAAANNDLQPWTLRVGGYMSQVVSDFTMLPTLLIIFKTMAHISRWTNWLGYAGAIAGRLGDLSLIVGALQDDLETYDQLSIRKLQYRFFRYLNTIHCLAYFDLDPRFPESPYDLCARLCHCKLLTEEESMRLVDAVPGGMHATVLTWVSILWHQEVDLNQGKGKNHPTSQNFMQKLMELRTTIASLQSARDYERSPDITDAVLYLVINTLLFFVIIAYPFKFYTADAQCVQFWAMISTGSFYLTYYCLLGMHDMLSRSPFDPDGDCVNIDNLLCEREEVLFYMMRASYAGDSMEGGRVMEHTKIFAGPRKGCLHSGSVPLHAATSSNDIEACGMN